MFEKLSESKLVDILGRNKFRWQRGYQYVAVISILFLVSDTLKKYAFFERVPIWILLVVGMISVWAIGYFIDSKAGLLKAEQRYWADQTPKMSEIIEKLDRIEKKLNEKNND